MSYKARNKTDQRLHDAWIGHFCNPIMSDRCPNCDLRKEGGWPINRAFCKATGRDVSCMDVESQCPRRDELSRLRHEENVQRHKARAAAKQAARDAVQMSIKIKEEIHA